MKTLILIIAASALCQAQSLSLTEAYQEALTHSPQLQKAKSVHEEASWKRVESYSGYLPTLGASATYLTDKRYLLTDVLLPGSPTAITIPGIVPTSNFMLTAQLPLFDGFASTNRYRSAKTMEDSAEQNLSWTQFQLQRQIILQYYKALAAQTLEDVANQNVKTLEDHLKDVNLFKKAGMFTNYDVLRVDVQVSEAKSELLNSADNSVLSRAKLAELLGNDSENRVIKGALPILNADEIKSVDLTTINDRKDINSLADQASAMGYLESAAGSYLIPKISLFGQYQYYNNLNDNISDKDAYREAYQIGINLNWNIFDGAVSMARSKQSIEQKYQAEKSLRVAQLKARQDIELWKRKFVYFCSVYRSRVSDVEKSTESVRLAREGRKVGARTNSELLDAETELFRARAGVVNAQLGAIEALVNLELATGKEIHHFN
jgi:outer membrane protein TolC